ncbi:uncharacterized protein LOC110876835 [Helianthus annuus]|uniref:uncharacterized protein LOC110875016 n=1 Tax=Helianthus annuus TaxID=4232 RepID=UPI000B905D28|nr:uncharacterized protein LOC110875016 [Helianthus annuus]XP_021980688.1 uncharacterized protein LOC110876835 [Helianthus annuus]
MGDVKTTDAGSSSNPKQPTLHPVYTFTNIQNKVRVLDGTKVTYSSWVKLFQLHARGYKVTHHIDGTPPPAKTDPDYESWMEIDAIVLQWIYGTLSDDLLVQVLEPESTALEAWLRIKGLFTNNKGSRAATLEHQFINLTLKSMPSLDAYCQRLKEIANQLADVDQPVSNQRLILQLVRGLPSEFDTTASIINKEIPTWEEAISLLQSDQQRQEARDSLASSAASPSVMTMTDENRQQQPPNRRQQSRGGGGLLQGRWQRRWGFLQGSWWRFWSTTTAAQYQQQQQPFSNTATVWFMD